MFSMTHRCRRRKPDAVGARRSYRANWVTLRDGMFLTPTRVYDSGDGRFLQRDPLGFVDGMSLYSGWFVYRLGKDPRGGKVVLENTQGYDEFKKNAKDLTLEIITKLEKSKTAFKFADICDFKIHVNARLTLVELFQKTKYRMGVPDILSELPKDSFKFYKDFFENIANYQVGCASALRLTLVYAQWLALLNTNDNQGKLRDKSFKPGVITARVYEDNHIPGDWLYISNDSFNQKEFLKALRDRQMLGKEPLYTKEMKQRLLEAGENILYVGGNKYAGLFQAVEVRGIKKWMEKVTNFPTNDKHTATLKKSITYPSVGLMEAKIK